MRHNSDQEHVDIEQLCHFTPKQYEAWTAVRNRKFVLYGGAMGGGKSYWLRWMLVILLFIYAVRGHRHVTAGLFCETYAALDDRHISKIKFEFPSWLGKYNEADHTFTLKEIYGGGVIAFRNLDDVSKYQSSEFAAIAVDELTKNQEIVFTFLRTRLRWPGIEKTKFIAATNPGGIGHAWVKKFWIDKQYSSNEKEADQFIYIRALVSDNPYLDIPSYLKTLESLPEERRRRFLEGDWDVFEGQYFNEWRSDIHVVEPFEIPRSWTKFVCIDYGYAKPSAAYWCAVDYDGRIFVYRELYGAEITYKDLASAILNATPRDEYIGYWVVDPSLGSASPESGLSGIERMYEAAFALHRSIQIIPANHNRLNGWRVMHEYLQTYEREGRKTAGLLFFKTCVNAIRTIPSLVYDSIRAEDLDTGGEDHSADAIRYGLMSRPMPGEKPPQEKTERDKFRELVERDLARICGDSGINDNLTMQEDDWEYGSGLE